MNVINVKVQVETPTTLIIYVCGVMAAVGVVASVEIAVQTVIVMNNLILIGIGLIIITYMYKCRK